MGALLAPLENIFLHVLEIFHAWTGSYGWAIVLLTIVVRVVILPLTIYQQVSMKKMQRLQPKIKELQEKHKGNAEKLNKEVMELYRTEKANPVMGCLPLIIQLPFLWAVYAALRSLGSHEAFFWIKDLAANTRDADPYYLLPILTGVTMLWSSYSMGQTADPTQRTMTYLMPLMFAWFTLNFPSGVAVYWVIGTLVQIAQNYLYPGLRGPKGEAAAR